MWRLGWYFLLGCLVTSCGEPDPGAGSTSSAGGAAQVGAATSTSQGQGGAGVTGSGGAAQAGPSATTGSPPPGLDDVGTLVVLGDSIGDGGGQGPFYYQLLRDALSAHYGKTIAYHNNAESGSKTGALLGQIDDLPNALVGPVAVAITSGGNDMKDSIGMILTGTDGPAREQMGSNIDAALGALLSPDRFGPGVAVHVFEANIYDASDGQGNYASGGCVINMNSPGSVDPYFDSWNGEIAERVAGHTQTLADMHGWFYGHGFNNPPSWYAGDCTHPNSVGHDRLHELFFSLITGAQP